MQRSTNLRTAATDTVEEQLFLVAYGWENGETLTYRFAQRRDVLGKKGSVGLASAKPNPVAIDRIILYPSLGQNTPLLMLDVIDGQLQWDEKHPLTITGKLRTYATTDGYVNLKLTYDQSGACTLWQMSTANGVTVPLVVRGGTRQSIEAALRYYTGASPNQFVNLPTKDLSSDFLNHFKIALNPKFDPVICQVNSTLRGFFVEVPGGVSTRPKYLLAFITRLERGGNCDTFRTPEIPLYLEEPDNGGGPALQSRTVSVDEGQIPFWLIRQGQPVDWISAAAKPEQDRNRITNWNIQISGVPAEIIPDLVNKYEGDYGHAVLTVGAGRPISFLPRLDPPTANPYPWMTVWNVVDFAGGKVEDIRLAPQTGKVTVQPLSLQPAQRQFLDNPQPQKNWLTGFLPLCQSVTRQPIQVRLELDQLDVKSDPRSVENQRGLVLNCSRPISVAGSPVVRMGSLAVSFGTSDVTVGDQRSRWSMRYVRGTVAVQADVNLFATAIVPGGQDDLPGEEFVPENAQVAGGGCELTVPTASSDTQQFEAKIERLFARARPLVVRIGSPSGQGSFLFRALEQNAADLSRTVRFTISVVNAPGTPTSSATTESERVVILDREPFLVAKVEFVPFTQATQQFGNVIATWAGDTNGTSWQILAAGEKAKNFIMTLPTQAVGEEMIKDKSFTGSRPADFRLGVPAKASLAGSYFPQAFVEPPWNLRRSLGFAGQRDAGEAVTYLQYELLYGLSCLAKAPFIRLAEVFSLSGAIPGRMEPEVRWPTLSPEQQTAYRNKRRSWAELYHRYLSRLAILQPWDSQVEGSLILSQNVGCRIRTKSSPVPATAAGKYDEESPDADLADPILPGDGLRGGVTWGFESRNVYTAVTRDPRSTAASITDLALSSLGAWGLQQASFDEGRTTIYSNAAMGRTYYYKLERIGRIACWWNKAKHVIVYERTVVPSRQFVDQQERLPGLPLLRKVEEYIEILDDERHYPDDQTLKQETPTGTGSALKGAEVRRGFVSSCRFPKSVKIPVLSSWGSDVGNTGWKVPLWRPGAQPPDVYPKPKISAGLISQFGDGTGEVGCDFSEPQNFYFYTDTQPKTGSNPDDWNSVLGVDYVDRIQPAAATDFGNGTVAQTSPGDIAVPPGFDICTFALERPTRPVDVGATRTSKPMAVALDAVTVTRCKFKAPDTLNGPAASTAQMGDHLRDAWRDILAQAAQPAPDLPAILNSVQSSFATGAFQQFTAAYNAAKLGIGAKVSDIQNRLKNADDQALQELRNQLQFGANVPPPEPTTNDKGLDSLLLALPGEIAGISQLPQPQVAQALHLLVTEKMAAVEESIRELRASPGQLAAVVRLYLDAAAHFLDLLSTLADTVLQGLGSATDELGQARFRISSQISAAVNRAQDTWNSAQTRTLEAWLPNPTSIILQPTDLKSQPTLKPVADEINSRLTALRSFAQTQLDSNPHVTVKNVQDAVNSARAAWPKAVNDALSPIAAAAVDNMNDPAIGAISKLIKWSTQQRTQLLALADATNINEVQRTLTAMLKPDSVDATSIYLKIADLDNSIKSQRDSLFQYVQSELISVSQAFENVTAQNIKNQIQQAFQNALQQGNPQKFVELLQSPLSDQFAATQKYFGKYFDVLRGADAPSFATIQSPGLALVRAFGDTPKVPGLDFGRDKIAYYFDELSNRVGVTPVIARAAEVGASIEQLSPVNITLPTLSLGDNLVPPDLRNFNLSSIFPKLAGLDLTSLFTGVHVLDTGDAVKVSHGVDPQARTAWLEIDVNTDLPSGPISVFEAAMLSVRLAGGNLQAKARLEARPNEPPARTSNGKFSGDWLIQLSGFELVRFVKTELTFDNSGHLHFSVKPANVQMNGILKFVSDFLASFSGKDSGLSVRLTNTGIQSLLSLPVPPFQGAVFGIANLRLAASFGIDVMNGFNLSVGFSLARRDAPFTLTIFILGGSGYLESTANYAPDRHELSCQVDMAIMASASLAISLGPISGGVYVYFGITSSFSFATGANATPADFRVGVVFIIRGDVNLLGIVSASIALLLEATYDTGSGRLTGTGQLSVSIKICWCFTLEINESVTYHVGGSGERAALLTHDSYPVLASLNAPGSEAETWSDSPGPLPGFNNPYINDYLSMLV